MTTLLDLLFGCHHKNYSFPLTLKANTPQRSAGCYVVCLDCGREFTYDWEAMKVVSRPQSAAAPTCPGSQEAY
jgi:hypothetical protein